MDEIYFRKLRRDSAEEWVSLCWLEYIAKEEEIRSIWGKWELNKNTKGGKLIFCAPESAGSVGSCNREVVVMVVVR